MSRSSLFPDLNKGTTFACFYSDGTVPDLMERFTKCVTRSAITTALSLKSRAGRPSIPVAFLSFRHLSCLSTNGLPTAVNSKCFFVNNFSVVDLKTGLAYLNDSNNLFTTDVKKELKNSEMLCLSAIILTSALIHVGIDFSFASGNIFFTDLQKDSESPLFSSSNYLL